MIRLLGITNTNAMQISAISMKIKLLLTLSFPTINYKMLNDRKISVVKKGHANDEEI